MTQRVLRITVDVTWPEGHNINLSVDAVDEIVRSAMGGVRAGLSDELVASRVTIKPGPLNDRGWHIHFGKTQCFVCREASQDGKE